MATASAKVIDFFAARDKVSKSNTQNSTNRSASLNSLPEQLRKEIANAKKRNRDRE